MKGLLHVSMYSAIFKLDVFVLCVTYLLHIQNIYYAKKINLLPPKAAAPLSVNSNRFNGARNKFKNKEAAIQL